MDEELEWPSPKEEILKAIRAARNSNMTATAIKMEMDKYMNNGLLGSQILTPKVRAGQGVAGAQSNKLSQEGALRLLAMRLRVAEGHVMPFDHISMHIGTDKVTVFVMAKGGPVILEDEEFIFPSDKLVAELRLLQG